MSIIFQNPGEINEALITTFGCNVKDSPSAIGYFGTGLKYAIAVLLREGQGITIWSGETKFSFWTSTEIIRGKAFEFIVMRKNSAEPVRLGFTTELGKNWTLQQAYRELYANCMDEGGEVGSGTVVDCMAGVKDETLIVVSGEDFEKVHENSSSFILPKTKKKLFQSPGVEVYEGHSNNIFYKGFAAGTTEKPSYYTYNIISNETLTEDRTFASMWNVNWEITYAIQESLSCEEALIPLLLGEDWHESTLSYSSTPSETFCLAVEALLRADPLALNPKALQSVRRAKPEVMKVSYQEVLLTIGEQTRLANAKHFCKTLGYNIDVYPVKIVEDLGQGILALASQQTIWLTKKVFDSPELEAALMEEYIHLATGLDDYSRALQNFLFNEIIRLGRRQPVGFGKIQRVYTQTSAGIVAEDFPF